MEAEQIAIWVDGGLSRYDKVSCRGRAYVKVNTSVGNRYIMRLETSDNTHMEAEFAAIIFGITEAVRKGAKIVFTDYKPLAEMVGKKHCVAREPRLRLVSGVIKSLVYHYKLRVEWVPRELNLAT